MKKCCLLFFCLVIFNDDCLKRLFSVTDKPCGIIEIDFKCGRCSVDFVMFCFNFTDSIINPPILVNNNGCLLYTSTGLHALRSIEDTYIFTTSSTSTDNLIHKFGDAINGTLIGATFEAVGFHNAVWKNLGGIDSLTEQERKEYLGQISEYLSGSDA